VDVPRRGRHPHALAREPAVARAPDRTTSSAARVHQLLPAALAHAACLAVAALLLLAAAQPLFAEDTWWHLGMGEAYAAHGPWLAADPFLFTASGPPAPAAWASDVALHGVLRACGFSGLRVAHALAVAAILALAWSALRRASDSALFASLGAALFGSLCAYRLFQLRPHLVSIAAALLLFRLLLEDGAPPARWRVATAVVLMAVWANAHGAFLLGPVLLASALLGLALAAPLRPRERAGDRARARRLAAALGLGILATLANPAGASLHGLYFAAGGETPALELVADEWSPLHLLELPALGSLPSPLTWLGVWGLLLATPAAVLLQEWARRREGDHPSTPPVDPALAGAAVFSLLALLSALRLVWMAVFPLLLLGRAVRARGVLRHPPRPAPVWGGALAAVLLVPAFVRFGDWPMISQGIQRASWARPYHPAKHHAHAVWFLRDAGLEGRLWNDYLDGNFLGYWLAPRLRVFVNGSLNVPGEVMQARRALIEHRGLEAGESFDELLDRYGVDLFFGTGLPSVPPPPRRGPATTAHLEGDPGWIPVFRNLESAVYLRRNARNRANLERVADYYARAGVAFDPEHGFDAERVLRESPRWALAHALVPVGFQDLERAALSPDPARRRAARGRLARLLAALGLYERAEALDRGLLRASPRNLFAARRLVWSLLRQGRRSEALEAAQRLAAVAAPDDGLSGLLVAAARAEPGTAPPAALLPLFTRPELPALLAGLRGPEVRSPPGRPHDLL
jgi:tetratricopeptide (TPR) repeat protein